MRTRSLALAAAILVGAALPAVAAYTTGSVNLRTGPGTGYGVITSAGAGNRVTVQSCVPGWCKVSYQGIRGWMSSSYIGGGPVSPRYAPKKYKRYNPPDVWADGYPDFGGRHHPHSGAYFSFGFGTGGSRGGFGYGHPWWW